MKFLPILCCGAVIAANLHAETWRVVELRELAGADAGEEMEREVYLNAAGMEDAVTFPSVRVGEEAEAFLAAPAEGGERAWVAKQGSFRVALRLPDDESIKGVLLLRSGSEPHLSAIPFKFDPSKSEAATEEEFTAVRQAHYARLAQASLPGAAWFRHRAGGATPPGQVGREPEDSLDSTFRLITGSRAVAENLALDRELMLAGGTVAEAVPLDGIKGVTVRAIDWSGKLKPGEVATDPLSLRIPHDQHALFLPSMDRLFDLIQLIEKEGAPILQSFDVRNPYRDLPSRYRTQMGLDVPELIASRLPVKGVGVTGGDPFFPSGTDVAILFATESPDALLETLATMIGLKAKLKGATTPEGSSYRGFQTPDRSFSAYFAKIGEVVVVANSPLQLKRLQAVADGTTPSLGSLDEFRFFRQRYPHGDEETAYLFLSDATIRRWASPQVRIAASRRTRAAAALGELTARNLDGREPGTAFGELLGKPHLDGTRVRSETYNTLGFLTPVSELDLTTATPAEAAAYERWRSGYESGWAQAFDPIAIRLLANDDSRELDVSVIPLTVDTDYRDWMDVTGTTRPEKGAVKAHADARLFLSFAVDPESKYFRELGEFSLGMIPGLKAKPLAWVGDSVSVFLDDGFFWKALQAGDPEDIVNSNYLRLPIGMRVASRSSARLAIFLAGLRGYIDRSAPGLLKWEQRQHGDQTYLAVLSTAEEDPSMQGAVYYAALKDSLLLSLDEKVLQRAIDRAGNIAPTGKHLHAQMNPSSAAALGAVFGDTLLDRQRLESWAALPILNEWRRLVAGKDPVTTHAEHFLEEIHCPGGQGYRWNESLRSMESVAFGHPADPRGHAASLKLLDAFSRIRADLEFEDDGLRMRATMDHGEPVPAPPAAAAGPEIPEGFPQPGDLIQPRVGATRIYRVTATADGGPYSKEVETLSVTPGEAGTVIVDRVRSQPPGEEDAQVHTEERRLDGDYHWVGSKREGFEKTFSRPMPILPAKLAPGLAFGGEHRSETKDEDGVSQEIGEVRRTVAGLESVTVPAGVFENCVRIDGEYDYFAFGTIGRVTESEWYAPGVGLVKMVWKDEFSSGIEELEKFGRPD